MTSKANTTKFNSPDKVKSYLDKNMINPVDKVSKSLTKKLKIDAEIIEAPTYYPTNQQVYKK